MLLLENRAPCANDIGCSAALAFCTVAGVVHDPLALTGDRAVLALITEKAEHCRLANSSAQQSKRLWP